MRKAPFSLIIPFLLVGCVHETELPQDQEGLHEVVFHAGWDPETRTVLQEDGSVWWEPGDEIVLLDEGDRYKFTSTNTEPIAKADFKGYLPNQLRSETLYAQYPYSDYGFCTEDYFTLEIPDVQYVTETLKGGQLISVAKVVDDKLFFYGAVSGIKLSVANEGIDRIVINAQGGGARSPLAGKVGGWIRNGLPEDCWEPFEGEGRFSITVYPADSEYFIPGKNYYIIMSLGGHSLDIVYYKGNTCATKTMEYTTFKRSTFKRCFNQDQDLSFGPAFDSYAYLPQRILPDNIDCKTITDVHFHTQSDVTTDYILEKDAYLDFQPVYFEMIGNEAHYYTSAEAYKLGGSSAAGMFMGWSNLKTLDLSMFNTELCNSTAMMFEGCINLETVDLSSFRTSNLQSIQAMFQCCKKLQAVDMSHFNFSSLFKGDYPSCEALFNRCYSLTKVDLGNLDVDERQCSHAMLDFAKFSRNCAVRCLATTREALSGDISRLKDNARYVTWFLPEDELPDFDPVVDPTLYKSTDYHKDKTVRLLNEATKGHGIDIVLMGDGYSDRMIADGTYDADMELAMDAIFSKEPYASFRDCFNVHAVYAVSESEIIYDSPTVFDSSMQEDYENGFYSYYDQDRVVEYAAIACNNLSEAGIVIILNQLNTSFKPLGIANVFISPGNTDISDYGSGGSIALVNRDDRSGTDTFSYTVSHEFGHVFAKLGDEYWIYADVIPDWEKNYLIEQSNQWGYWKNIDFTQEPASVKWIKFLVDERYADTGLGVFGGGQGYAWGVYHPSENNLMKNTPDNTARFDAPSREAIYYRINKLAFGNDWNYSYEDFVSYDMKNIEADKAATSSINVSMTSSYVPIIRKPVFEVAKVLGSDGKERIKITME